MNQYKTGRVEKSKDLPRKAWPGPELSVFILTGKAAFRSRSFMTATVSGSGLRSSDMKRSTASAARMEDISARRRSFSARILWRSLQSGINSETEAGLQQ